MRSTDHANAAYLAKTFTKRNPEWRLLQLSAQYGQYAPSPGVSRASTGSKHLLMLSFD
ncbi:hypothetical protein SAMN04488094_10161 [Tropicimonas isoalkanivorans]|uniref:Uncharacterized protein n=1 Tax=Tropicimonas isoalkanivorans TaxID=441112 RepID=A0A1I1DDN0_9RHOB|nr:hypothetical protein SAMN04488094_10161 [Tropicimonas isoalkanivorans]